MTFQLQTDKNSFQFRIIFIGMNPLKEGANSRMNPYRSSVGDPSSGVMFHSGSGHPMDLDKLA